MAWVWIILTGFFVGLIARALKPGNDKMGILFTTVLGIAGALIAALVGQALGLYRPDEPAGFIGAIIGAVLVLAVATPFRRKRMV